MNGNREKEVGLQLRFFFLCLCLCVLHLPSEVSKKTWAKILLVYDVVGGLGLCFLRNLQTDRDPAIVKDKQVGTQALFKAHVQTWCTLND